MSTGNFREGPCPPDTRTFKDLLHAAMEYGLGKPASTPSDQLSWTQDALATAISERPGGRRPDPRLIRYWRAGDGIGRPYLDLLIDVFTVGGTVNASWRDSFEIAFLQLKSEKSPNYKSHVRKLAQTAHESLHHKFHTRFAEAISEIFLVGPSYLDFILNPITTKRLGSDLEYANLNKPDIRLGGSAVLVGRHLYAHYNIKSNFATYRSSKDDYFGFIVENLFTRETWCNARFDVSNVTTPPVTFALRQSTDASKTMFTYRSNFTDFSWSNILPHIANQKSPALVYISGVGKTSLKEDMPEALAQVSDLHLTVMDAGRFTPEEFDIGLREQLRNCVDFGLIDFFISNVDDLGKIFNLDIGSATTGSIIDFNNAVERIAANIRSESETIIVIRDYNYFYSRILCSIIAQGQLYHFSERSKDKQRFRISYVYSANEFNANLIGQFIQRIQGADDTIDLIKAIVEEILS